MIWGYKPLLSRESGVASNFAGLLHDEGSFQVPNLPPSDRLSLLPTGTAR
jgi:hypothetical protein